jgi:hypothetical protein
MPRDGKNLKNKTKHKKFTFFIFFLILLFIKDERVRHVVSQNENLHKSNQHIRQLLKTQGEWYEDKVADLTEEVNLLENKVNSKLLQT